MNRRHWSLLGIACALSLCALAQPLGVTSAAAIEKAWDGSEPPTGIYFYWYEPSFYTGFAPRTQDKTLPHIRLSRGNQVRFTMVLGNEELDGYLDGLESRRKTYQELIDRGVIELTTNKQYESFAAKLEETKVAAAIAARGSQTPEEYRAKTVEILEKLNPGRIFRIHMPVARVASDWHGTLTSMSDADFADRGRRLDAANAVLPGRVNLYELTPKLDQALAEARKKAATEPADSEAWQGVTTAFLQEATKGRYVVKDGHVDAVEFTAIYPAGTIEGWTTYKGKRLPAFGVTGVWSLISRDEGRGQVGMVDYISNNPGYGFISMLPYEHAGGIYYNAFHNAGVRSQLNSTPFLPKEWRNVPGERTPNKGYQNLWIVSRGPTSHGCTRLPSGHMAELRDSLPSTSDGLEGIDTYRNLPQCFDVFDIDGDGSPEVMGVEYYLAYRSNKHTPVEAYVTNRREPYYAWLYGDAIQYDAEGKARVREVPVCRFEGKRKAKEVQVLTDLPLYEAKYEPEAIQFYKLKPASFESGPGFVFNREIRRVGSGYQPDRAKLLLGGAK
ncbi:MAG: hypothetical protein FJ144_22090 [Deltaproteobacteria bacterium]|nr:hypothetical protein [Deltaproteobacteria bacterium]